MKQGLILLSAIFALSSQGVAAAQDGKIKGTFDMERQGALVAPHVKNISKDLALGVMGVIDAVEFPDTEETRRQCPDFDALKTFCQPSAHTSVFNTLVDGLKIRTVREANYSAQIENLENGGTGATAFNTVVIDLDGPDNTNTNIPVFDMYEFRADYQKPVDLYQYYPCDANEPDKCPYTPGKLGLSTDDVQKIKKAGAFAMNITPAEYKEHIPPAKIQVMK